MEKMKYDPVKVQDTVLVFRRFFQTLKAILKNTFVYLFMTGISPQSLNDFTSGFNVGLVIGEDIDDSSILGYPEEFVKKGITLLGIPESLHDNVLNKLKEDNNGYRYCYSIDIDTVYNPAKINYCFKKMQKRARPINFD